MGIHQIVAVGVCISLAVSSGCRVRSVENLNESSSATDAGNIEKFETPSGVAMVLLPGGTFVMGNDSGAADEQPARKVTVSGFAMDVFEVTQNQLAAMESPNPSQFKGDLRPVEQMRWTDAALFCNLRSDADGLEPCYNEATFACNFQANGYRLPTEAEWEYAARAGSTGDVYFSPSEKLISHACYADTSQQGTDEVGSRRANAWGLYDMLGNVAEWCQDVYSPTYYADSATEVTSAENGVSDPLGPTEGPKRVLRGGSWKSSEAECRVSSRAFDDSGIADACFARNYIGFRCVRRISAEESQRFENSSPSTAK